MCCACVIGFNFSLLTTTINSGNNCMCGNNVRQPKENSETWKEQGGLVRDLHIGGTT